MTFGAPLWLIGMIPWAGVALYLLTGRRRKESVPFLGLWIGPVTGPPARRKAAVPPLAVALALLATLLALLAAARPRVQRAGAGAAARVRIVVDRGASMSARGKASPRFIEAAETVSEELAMLAPSASVEIQTLPDGDVRRSSVAAWLDDVRRLSRTAVDTGPALAATLATIPQAADAVVVLSDRAQASADDRLVIVAPDSGVSNAGIDLVAVRESPRPEVMVRLRNDTPLRSARLEITTAGQTTAADVELPPAGAEPRDAFVDVARIGDVVAVKLVAADSFDADNVAWFVREGNWPRIEPRVPLPPELARMVEVYSRSRPVERASVSVAIVHGIDAVPPGMPAVVLAPVSAGTSSDASEYSGPAEVVPHPVTRNLQGDFRFTSVRGAGPGPAGWTPVVRFGGATAVAVREQSSRQVWVGLDSPEWARQAQYVVFWANVFDWLGGSGGPQFRAHPVGALGAGWRRVEGDDVGVGADAEPGLWPGLYERAEDGTRRAVNATAVRFPPPAGLPDWRKRLAAALVRHNAGLPLAPALLVGAVACLALAAVLWRPRRIGMS